MTAKTKQWVATSDSDMNVHLECQNCGANCHHSKGFSDLKELCGGCKKMLADPDSDTNESVDELDDQEPNWADTVIGEEAKDGCSFRPSLDTTKEDVRVANIAMLDAYLAVLERVKELELKLDFITKAVKELEAKRCIPMQGQPRL